MRICAGIIIISTVYSGCGGESVANDRTDPMVDSAVERPESGVGDAGATGDSLVEAPESGIDGAGGTLTDAGDLDADAISPDAVAHDAGVVDVEGPGDSYRRVFVTSGRYGGELGGLDGADGYCQAAADTAGLGGSWKAWLSDSTSCAEQRLEHSAVPYRLLNGVQIASDWGDLTDGMLDAAINITEEKSFVGSLDGVWTSTTLAGEWSPIGWCCSDWTNFAASDEGMTGHANRSDGWWTASGGAAYCNYSWRLYCFEQHAESDD
jgi:hypothetical protein